jgi:hypothetical protein
LLSGENFGPHSCAEWKLKPLGRDADDVQRRAADTTDGPSEDVLVGAKHVAPRLVTQDGIPEVVARLERTAEMQRLLEDLEKLFRSSEFAHSERCAFLIYHRLL